MAMRMMLITAACVVAAALRTAAAAPAEEKAAPPQPAAVPLTGHKGAVRAVAFSPDGKAVATAGADKTVRLWDAAAGQESLERELPGEAVSVAFSPDGKTFAAATGGKDAELILWDVNGKQLWRISLAGEAVAFSPAAKVIAASYTGGWCAIGMIDAASGKPGWAFTFDNGAPVTAATFSPEGKIVAAGYKNKIQFLDVETGKPIHGRLIEKGFVESLTFLSGGNDIAVLDDSGTVRLLHSDPSNAKQEAVFKGPPVRALAVSRDGKLVATAAKDGEVRLWDPGKGEEKRRFAAGEAAINGIAFSQDGESLATVSEDGAAVLWDLTRDEKPLAKDLKLTEKDMAGPWDDLAADGAGKVYSALRMLRADPVRAVPFLQERLRPRAEGPDAKKLKRLIADLDADDFEVREKATKDLEKLGKNAESALRAVLAGSPNLEVKMRAERLLTGIGDEPLTAEQKRDVRAVRLLEQAGTPEAKALLESLTRESPGWWVTQEAKAALERMAKREKKP